VFFNFLRHGILSKVKNIRHHRNCKKETRITADHTPTNEKSNSF
jgi:hypothetical protein